MRSESHCIILGMCVCVIFCGLCVEGSGRLASFGHDETRGLDSNEDGIEHDDGQD